MSDSPTQQGLYLLQPAKSHVLCMTMGLGSHKSYLLVSLLEHVPYWMAVPDKCSWSCLGAFFGSHIWRFIILREVKRLKEQQQHILYELIIRFISTKRPHSACWHWRFRSINSSFSHFKRLQMPEKRANTSLKVDTESYKYKWG